MLIHSLPHALQHYGQLFQAKRGIEQTIYERRFLHLKPEAALGSPAMDAVTSRLFTQYVAGWNQSRLRFDS